MNKVILIGRLTKDVDVSVTTNGLSVSKFTLAVDRIAKTTDGKSCDFIEIVAWRTLAELCGMYLSKGKKCAVVGRMQTRTYEATDGTKRYITEVVADELEFLSPKEVNENVVDSTNNTKANKTPLQPLPDNDLPF